MTRYFGSPSIIWTFTPNPNRSLSICVWDGAKLAQFARERGFEGTTFTTADLRPEYLPPPSFMTTVATGNAVLQGEYYLKCCDILIETLLGSDTKHIAPKDKPGIFRHMQAIFYAEESQGRLTVHYHGIGWIIGMPRSTTESERSVQSFNLVPLKSHAQYKHLLKRDTPDPLVAVCKKTLPLYLAKAERGRHEGDPAGRSHKKPFRAPGAPKVPAPDGDAAAADEEAAEPPNDHDSDATVSGNEMDLDLNDDKPHVYTNRTLLESVIEAAVAQLSEEKCALITDEYITYLTSMVSGYDIDSLVRVVQMTKALLLDRIHSCRHVPICCKGKKGTACRYTFPRATVLVTRFNKQDEYMQIRRLGNEWVNTYVEAWRRLFHFNMDAWLLIDSAGVLAMLYATKYATKMRELAENSAVLLMAFKKRLQKEGHGGVTSGPLRRLMSRLLAVTSNMEIGAPLAMSANLVLVEALNLLEGVNQQVTLGRRRDGTITINKPLKDYLFRPRALKKVLWYEFVSKCTASGVQEVLDCNVNRAANGLETLDAAEAATRVANRISAGFDPKSPAAGKLALPYAPGFEKRTAYIIREHSALAVPLIIDPSLPNVRNNANNGLEHDDPAIAADMFATPLRIADDCHHRNGL
ncbi:hypothetical protein H9P43_003839 [Blastocladiella emersonii ATCC 22665]|nr:hypothetical protein H9P43_003839 [Blastocladiella emersonii ATCC 22665]